ncbi:G-alpha and/or Arf domain containing protein [Asbolus verrucosus]|uniref:Guanine nucleotide-binding protein G(s) subunit alpha n=1 Tax=Asbolus verrucosus TaxID=1661398 RepID=A0A482WCY6_ASBVE|nr:G-alpha and/or Arf domain containing protein [Asbolus verrucosus]
MFGCGSRKTDSDDEEHDRRFGKAVKLLLLGTGESGKTTIIKQMKILHINGFSEQEKKEKIRSIKQNIHESIHDIVSAMAKIAPPVQLEKAENQTSVEFILKLGPEEPEGYSEEYFDHVKTLWGDRGVQQTFERSNEYQLIDSAQHFLDRIDEIRKKDYIPTTQDILFCRIRTTAISEIEFSVALPKMYGGGRADFLMFDVGGQRGERRKWIQVFDGIDAILFIIAASDFDQTLREDESKNRLEEAFMVYEDICGSRFLRSAGMIVFLNKQDLLRRKIEQGRKIDKYFPEFNDFTESNVLGYDRAKLFLEKKINELSKIEVLVKSFNPIKQTVVEKKLPPRDVYVHHTIATDTNNVKKVFDSVQEMIIKTVIKSFSNY